MSGTPETNVPALMKGIVSAWERATANMTEAVVRDPRTLELGARMLRAHLLWRRAFDTAWRAAWTPFHGLEKK